jgi:hypothetical protein
MATTIFGSERRLIRREDGVLPFLQPDYEPGPGEYGIEMQTRMSYELEQKNMSPGVYRSSFGVAERNKGPWTYLKKDNGNPGPMAYISEYGSLKSTTEEKDYCKMYKTTVSEMVQSKMFPTSELTDSGTIMKDPLVSVKPRDYTAERFQKNSTDTYKYLLGPGSYPDNDQFAAEVLATHSYKGSTFGDPAPIESPVQRKIRKSSPDVVTREEYLGPKSGGKMRDYNNLYEKVAFSMENGRLDRDKKIQGQDLWKARKKLNKKLKDFRSRFKAPAPHFGSAIRFRENPPPKTYPNNKPGPGSYKTLNDTFAAKVAPQETELLSKKKSATSSFLGGERDTQKLMERCGKGLPRNNPGPNAYEVAGSSLENSSHNVIAFQPSPIKYRGTKIKGSRKSSPLISSLPKTSLKKVDISKTLADSAWFARTASPSLAGIKGKFPVKSISQISSPKLIDTQTIQSNFFKQKIKGGHKPKITKIH